jgi:hypothetical protein
VRQRTCGEIETLSSGSLRVRVYAGIDPVSKKKHYLVETVPAGPKAAREAEKVRTRPLNQVDEKRNPRTRATVNLLMDRYLELIDIEETTRGTYKGYIRNHIRPLLVSCRSVASVVKCSTLSLYPAPRVPGALQGTQIHRAPRPG